MRLNYSYLKQELKELQKEQKAVKYGAFAMIALLILVILVSILKQYFLTLACLALVLFLQLFYFRKKRKAYQNHLQRVNTLTVTGGMLGTAELDEKGGAGLSVETLKQAELLSYQDRGRENNFFLGVRGKYEKLSVTTADAAIVQFYGADAHRAEVNCGNWTHIVLPKDTGMNLRILDREAMRLSVQQEYFASLPHLTEAAAESLGLPETFLVYGTATEQEQPALPERFLVQLKELQKYTPGKLAISIRGSEIDVYVRNRFLGRNFPANVEPTEQLLTADAYPELEKICRLANALL